jgi:hypothetical protein
MEGVSSLIDMTNKTPEELAHEYAYESAHTNDEFHAGYKCLPRWLPGRSASVDLGEG